ncbi:GNAT family N-acetyltransferase [Paenibacillus cymbidii]|uniref:GNAT family N-acetyltransferase n=1 Tax=Paenibacillus cymbidii TaxID=1639034 RepID=UPI001081045E|nr:GNAT family N-acetyltransferase [Paenibacillus cymbidii]
MIDIRQLRREEVAEALRLSEFAFQYELTDEERARRVETTNPEQVWACFVDGALAAKLSLLPLHTWLHGKPFALGGVASVATWPEFRRQGLVARLLKLALERMKAGGQTLSFLHPFEFGFYRKYGWETYVDIKSYTIEAAQLPTFAAVPGKMRRTDDWRELREVYAAYAADYNGAIARDERWWTDRIFARKKGFSAVYDNEAGQARGYVRYLVRDSVMTVHELVHLDEEARRGLWRFIANHDSMLRKVELKAPSDDDLPFLLADPRIKQEVEPYFMARVVDAEALLRLFPFAPAAAGGTLRLRLRDEFALWNDGAYEVAFGAGPGGEARVTRPAAADAEAAGSGDDAAACDIQTLASLLMGYKRPAELARIGRLAASEAAVALLEAALPRRTTYLPDYF